VTLTSHVRVPGSITVRRVLGNKPSPSQLRSVSVSTLTSHSITVPCDFRLVGKLCRLGGFLGFFRGMAILCSCAWRIPVNRYNMVFCGLSAYASPRNLILASIKLRPMIRKPKAGQPTFSRCTARIGRPPHPLRNWACRGPLLPVTKFRASQAKSCRFECPARSRMSVWCSPPGIRRLRRLPRHGAPDGDQ